MRKEPFVKIILFSRLTLFGRRYFWKAVGANGESVAIGGEGYNSKGKRNYGLGLALSLNMATEVFDND